VIEASMVQFVAALVQELVEEQPIPSSRRCSDSRIADQLRSYLHEQPWGTIELSQVARQSGMSRFKMLRTFKRRFGVPPHVYQLQMRLSLAQQALQKGAKVADVAAACGFFDQSHLTGTSDDSSALGPHSMREPARNRNMRSATRDDWVRKLLRAPRPHHGATMSERNLSANGRISADLPGGPQLTSKHLGVLPCGEAARDEEDPLHRQRSPRYHATRGHHGCRRIANCSRALALHVTARVAVEQRQRRMKRSVT
jgi:AraC-like DNA-binding protein